MRSDSAKATATNTSTWSCARTTWRTSGSRASTTEVSSAASTASITTRPLRGPCRTGGLAGGPKSWAGGRNQLREGVATDGRRHPQISVPNPPPAELAVGGAILHLAQYGTRGPTTVACPLPWNGSPRPETWRSNVRVGKLTPLVGNYVVRAAGGMLYADQPSLEHTSR
jgi:hypothetical protein